MVLQNESQFGTRELLKVSTVATNLRGAIRILRMTLRASEYSQILGRYPLLY